jgi:hypothetical protein
VVHHYCRQTKSYTYNGKYELNNRGMKQGKDELSFMGRQMSGSHFVTPRQPTAVKICIVQKLKN